MVPSCTFTDPALACQNGMPVAAGIWNVDPPASSYPACIAVKAAEQQEQTIGAMYLRRLHEAVMLEQRNIVRSEVLLALAEKLTRDGQLYQLYRSQVAQAELARGA
ncbi:MAG: DsbA family protein [Chloroflexaceae bacterium]